MIPALLLGLATQNVVEGDSAGRTLPPKLLAAADLEPLLASPSATPGTEARLKAKLEAHVIEFLEGFPWRPFHQTIGIGGYESFFGHPERVFLALAEALPQLSPATAQRARAFLSAQLAALPPWAPEGYDPAVGRPRELYDVPEAYRLKGRAKATGLLGVHAFERAVAGGVPPGDAWAAIKSRVTPILAKDYAFDPLRKTYSKDEAQVLNADLAGLAAYVRLARRFGDADAEAKGATRALQLLNLRVALERGNARILEKSDSTSAHLHVSKLARYCDLAPALAEAVRVHSEGLAAERLKAFREERNAWWLAFGDRMIGGENYTNPPHFVDALLRGAAWIERLPGARIRSFVDIPWCRGDLYFIEWVALALATPG
jgi:hypothetical protein